MRTLMRRFVKCAVRNVNPNPDAHCPRHECTGPRCQHTIEIMDDPQLLHVLRSELIDDPDTTGPEL